MDSFNPYAPPTAATAPDPVAVDDPRIAAARAALAAHLADPRAVAADRRGRWSCDPSVLICAEVFIAFLAVAVVLDACLGPRHVLTIIVAIDAAFHALVTVTTLFSANPHWWWSGHPTGVVRSWLRGLSQDLPHLSLAMLAPSARTSLPLPGGGGNIPVADAAGMRRWIHSAIPAWWKIANLRTISVREDRRTRDLAWVCCQIDLNASPGWFNAVVLASVGVAGSAYGPAVVLFHDPLVALGLGAFIVLVVVMSRLLIATVGKCERITLTKCLLHGADGRWYLLDGALADDPPAP